MDKKKEVKTSFSLSIKSSLRSGHIIVSPQHFYSFFNHVFRSYEKWDTLIELSDVRPGEWTLIGGQMVFLHGIEHGATPPRISTDLDVVVNARIAGRPVAAFATGLEDLGFE